MRRRSRLVALLAAGMMSSMMTQAIFAEEAPAADDAVSLEQVYVNMPEITVYGSNLNLNGEAPEVYLGEEKLTWAATENFQNTEEGIGYYVLLDISGSIPKSYFSEVKNAVGVLAENMRVQDNMTVVSFGEDVQVLVKESNRADVVNQALEEVENRDQETLLFEAIDQSAELMAKADQPHRKVMLVISDGEDIAVGKKMSQETLDNLKAKEIPVYAMCIKDTDSVNINSFGEFARISGGKLCVFQANETTEQIQDIQNTLLNGDVMRLRASGNKISNSYQRLSLYAPSQGTGTPVVSKDVLCQRWIPDTVAPEIMEISTTEDARIHLTFSERVVGSDVAANYQLTKEGENISISTVTNDPAVLNGVFLTPAQPLSGGTYEVRCTNIADDSQEANAIEKMAYVNIETPEEQQVESKTELEPGINKMLLLIIAVVALAVIALIVLAASYSTRRKKDTGSTVAPDNGIGTDKKKMVELTVKEEDRAPDRIMLAIDPKVIVGRSASCDLSFPKDARMSKQHFSLEWNGKDIVMEDLDSLNGSYVDQKKVKILKLNSGDTVRAGKTEFTLKW